MANSKAFFRAGLGLFLDGDKELTDGLGRVNREVSKTDQAIQQFTGSLDRAGERMQSIGQGAMVAGAALLAPLAGSISQAIDVEDQLIKLQSTGVLAQNQLTESRRAAIGWMQEHRQTAGQFLDTQYRMISAGLEHEAALYGTQTALEVATATFGDNTETAELLATVYGNLGDRSADVRDEMTRLGNILTLTQQNFQLADLNQLSESFKDGTPAALQYGLSVEQLALSLGALNTAGLQGSRAGTALEATMARLSKASRELGITVERTADGGIDLIGTVRGMREQFGNFADLAPKTQEKLRQVFGEQGIRGITLLMSQLDQLEGGTEMMDNLAGATGRAVGELEKAASFKLKRAMNNLRAFGVTAGDHFLAPLGAGADLLSWATQKLTTFTEAHPIAAKAIFGTTGALGSLLLVGGGGAVAAGLGLQAVSSAIEGYGELSGALKTARGAYKRILVGVRGYVRSQEGASAAALHGASGMRILGTAAKTRVVQGLKAATAGLWTFRGAMIATGIGALVVGIATAGVLVYKHWDRVKALFGGLWSEVGPKMRPITEFLTGVWRVAKFALGRTIDWLYGLVAPADASADALGRMEKAGRLLAIGFTPLIEKVKTVIGWIRTYVHLTERMAKFAANMGLLPDHIQESAQDYLDFVNQARRVAAGKPAVAQPMGVPESGPLRSMGVSGPGLWDPATMLGGITPESAGMSAEDAGDLARRSTPRSGSPSSSMSNGGRQEIRVTIEDNRTVNVGAGGDPQSVQRGLDMSNRELEQRIQRILQRESRSVL